MSIFDYTPKVRSILDPDLFTEEDLTCDDFAADYRNAVMGKFLCTPHTMAGKRDIFEHRVSERPLDPLAHLRDLIDHAATQTARTPNRIRINDMVPAGMMIQSPYELDDSAPAVHRTLTDGGPQEIIVNPADWEALARPFCKHVNDNIDRVGYVPVDELHDYRHVSPFGDGICLWGIPVFDDTTEARMRRAA